MAASNELKNALVGIISDELTDDSEKNLFDHLKQQTFIQLVFLHDCGQSKTLVQQNKYNSDILFNCFMDYLHDTDRNPKACVQSYIEEIVPLYTGAQFHEHFRMNRNTFEVLCQWISPHLPKERSISIDKMLATLWLLGNQESFRGVADRFGLNKGTLHKVVISVCKCLTMLQKEVIRWPANRISLEQNAQCFTQRFNFPSVVGLIDGTYINIPGPSDNRDAYLNRKGHTSMHLQVICDSQLKFIDVFTGWSGSVHDSRVYHNSDIKIVIENMPPQYHILGDSAYGLSNSLMVPFRDNGHLNDIEKKTTIIFTVKPG